LYTLSITDFSVVHKPSTKGTIPDFKRGNRKSKGAGVLSLPAADVRFGSKADSCTAAQYDPVDPSQGHTGEADL
jgi:hypothetical protein